MICDNIKSTNCQETQLNCEENEQESVLMSLAPGEVKKRKRTYSERDLSVLEKHSNEQTKVDQDG